MENKLSRSVLFATTALSLGLTGQAVAQESGDIVVTARRIEERLQDVPISITVFNQEQIDDRNITDVVSLASYTPSLSTQNQFGANNAQFAIRGFVQDPFTAPSVGVYFADVIAPRGASSFQSGDGAGPGSFFDLQNVQVLKGPQGTLFGRNTTGGSILLVPQKPTYEFEGYLEQSIGNYDMLRTQAVLNVPLGDQARARFGIDRQTREGYQDNIGPVGPEHFSDTDYWAARASLVVDLAPNLENYTIVTYANSDTNGNMIRPHDCNPATVLRTVVPVGQWSCNQLDRLNADGDFYDVENQMDNPRNQYDEWRFINTTTWDISDNLTFKNIISYSEIRNELRTAVFGNRFVTTAIDLDPVTPGVQGVPAGIDIIPVMAMTIPGGAINHSSTFTEELQFQGTGFDNRLTWQAGVYYEAVEQIPQWVGTQQGGFTDCDEETFFIDDTSTVPQLGTGTPRFGNPNQAACDLPLGFLGLSSLSREIRSSAFYDSAVYMQGTYDVTDNFHITTGLRYTDDQSEGTTQAHTWYYNLDPDGPGPAAAAAEAIACTDPSATFATNCTRTTTQHSNATTGEIVFAYDLTDSWNTYIKYARGYRQGMANARGFGFLSSFEPEQIDLNEVGFKGNWRGGMPGYVNVAVFTNLLQNQQLNVSYTSPQGSIASGVLAGGKTRVNGVEIDGSISLFEGFRVSGGLAWLESDLKSVDVPTTLPGWGPVTNFPSPNQHLSFTPEWKYSITPSYTLPLSENIGEITLSATWSWTSDYVGGSGFAEVDSWGILNLNAGWDRVLGSPVDLSFFGTNVLDEEYYATAANLMGSLGFQYGAQGEPRMYGMRLRYNFGAAAE